MTDTTTPAAPTAPEAPATEIVYDTPEKFFGEILARSGLESFGDVLATKRIAWQSPDGLKMIDVNGQSPFDVGSNVLALFYDEDEARIYTSPKEKGEFKLYTLVRHLPTAVPWTVDGFRTIEQLIDVLADEYKVLGIAAGVIEADDEPDDEDEPEATPGASQ